MMIDHLLWLDDPYHTGDVKSLFPYLFGVAYDCNKTSIQLYCINDNSSTAQFFQKGDLLTSNLLSGS